jgi:predicted RNA-binding protein associated with RNAse of E/G family
VKVLYSAQEIYDSSDDIDMSNSTNRVQNIIKIFRMASIGTEQFQKCIIAAWNVENNPELWVFFKEKHHKADILSFIDRNYP